MSDKQVIYSNLSLYLPSSQEIPNEPKEQNLVVAVSEERDSEVTIHIFH